MEALSWRSVVFLAALSLFSCSKFSRLEGSDRVASVTVGASSAPSLASPNWVSDLMRPFSTPQLGGIMLYARNAVGTVASVYLPTETAYGRLNLTFGTWEFFAVGWDGTNIFDGNSRCGNTAVTVDSTTTDVTVSIGLGGCTPTFYGASASVIPLKVVSCNALTGVVDGMSTCTGGTAGDVLSVQVAGIAYNPVTNRPPTATDVAYQQTSDCVALAGGANGTLLHVPDGETGFSPMFYQVKAYSDAACLTQIAAFNYPKGLRNGAIDGASKLFTGISVNSGKNVLYLSHGPLPPPTVSSLSPTSGGWGGMTPLTINGTNFDPAATVTVGGVACNSITWVSATQITCMPPLTSTPGNALVVVKNPDNQTASMVYVYVDDGFGIATDAAAVGTSFTVNYTISDTGSQANALGSRTFETFRNVTNISGPTLTVNNTPTITSADYAAGDTVLWHISAASLAAACGTGYSVGQFGTGIVSGVNNATGEVSLTTNFPGTPNNTNIAAATRTSGSTFCAIQLVRIPSFQNFTYDSTAAAHQISPPPFSLTTGTGGIVAMQVNGTLTVPGGNSSDFDANSKGQAGGTGATIGNQGDGSIGIGSAVNAANGTGGGGAGSTKGAGGGGSNGAGGNGGGNTGSGGTSNASCDPFTNSCATLGGGGGGGSAIGGVGGAGGGVILIFARNVVATGGNFYLAANGSVAGTNGAGGGAGGTAYLRSLSATSDILNLQTMGGTGGSGTFGGGGGGGGISAFHGCSSAAPTTTNASFTGGAAGTGSGPALAGSNGAGGYAGSASGVDFCP
ncbi:MAG: IPT/TIG domain-containing protein [Bdellovibrionota bacterium]